MSEPTLNDVTRCRHCGTRYIDFRACSACGALRVEVEPEPTRHCIRCDTELTLADGHCRQCERDDEREQRQADLAVEGGDDDNDGGSDE